MTGRRLVSHWRMDDTVLVQDVGWKGNRNDGTVAGTPLLVDGIAGKNALHFDGATEYVSIVGMAPGDSLEFGNDFSISAWVRPDSLGPLMGIFKRGIGSSAPANQEYALFLAGAGEVGVYFGDGAGGGQSLVSAATVAAGEWAHVGLSVDALDNVLLVKNGVAESVGTKTRVWAGTSTQQLMAAMKSNGNWFDGVLDKIVVFNAGLAPLQWRDLYELQRQGIAA